MGKQQITLELDEQQYDALQKSLQLRGSDIESEMQERLEQCYLEMVPAGKRREIADASRITLLSVLRVTDHGKTRCVQMDGMDSVEAMARLTRHLDKTSSAFEEMFPKRKIIAEHEFTACAFQLLGFSEQVQGVFDIDLDAGTFSTLDADIGWRTFSASGIREISHRLDESGIEDKAKLARYFRDLPYSIQIVNPNRLSLLHGSQPIKAEDIDLDEFLVEDDGIIVFIVDVLADEREVFGTELFANEDSYFVFYAVYNTNTKQVSSLLDISLMRSAETVEFVCPLPPETVEGLKQKMDEYSMTWSGKHLDELGTQEYPSQTESGMEQRL